MIFIYDGLRYPGNIAVMVQTTNILFGSGKVTQICLKPQYKSERISHIPNILIQIMIYIIKLIVRLVGGDLHDYLKSDRALFAPDGSYNSAMRRQIESRSMISRIEGDIKQKKNASLYYKNNLSEVLEMIQGMQVYVIENDKNAVSTEDFDWEAIEIDNACFIFGSEKDGVRQEFLDIASTKIFIPTVDKYSLSVSIAHSIISMYLANH